MPKIQEAKISMGESIRPVYETKGKRSEATFAPSEYRIFPSSTKTPSYIVATTLLILALTAFTIFNEIDLLLLFSFFVVHCLSEFFGVKGSPKNAERMKTYVVGASTIYTTIYIAAYIYIYIYIGLSVYM
jgi:hypothetical protein